MPGEKGFLGRGNSPYEALNDNQKPTSQPVGLGMVNKEKRMQKALLLDEYPSYKKENMKKLNSDYC